MHSARQGRQIIGGNHTYTDILPKLETVGYYAFIIFCVSRSALSPKKILKAACRFKTMSEFSVYCHNSVLNQAVWLV